MIDRKNLPLLVTLALGVFVGALDLGVLSSALPALAHTFAIPGRDVGGVVGTSISNPQAYRVLYLIFASIALVATCVTSLLAPRARERSLTSPA